jgi:mono/diheme cytochrome c family protein
MPPVGITADETAAIQDYLLSLGDGVDISTLNGLEVYELRCASCHGDEGQGSERAFQLRYRADEYSKYVVRHGRASSTFESDMPAFDEISDEQLDEMFDWLGSFPNPQDDQGLYERYCANCHGDDGRGGPIGKHIASSSESTEKIREGENVNSFGNRREFMPRWNTEQIGSTEASAIASYVASLPE